MANRIQKHAYVCKIYVCKIWFPFHFKKKTKKLTLNYKLSETHVDDILGMYLVTASRRMHRKICKSIFSPGFSCTPRHFAFHLVEIIDKSYSFFSFNITSYQKIVKYPVAKCWHKKTKLIFIISPSLRSEYFNG